MEKFSKLQAACPWKNKVVGAGIYPINSNKKSLHSNMSITIQCNIHVYLHIHISDVLASAHGQTLAQTGSGRPSVSDLNPLPHFFDKWSFA